MTKLRLYEVIGAIKMITNNDNREKILGTISELVQEARDANRYCGDEDHVSLADMINELNHAKNIID